jgi:hypothetical protein
MENLSYLLDLIKKSRITIIGYHDSDIKNRFLNNLGVYSLGEISNFNPKSIVRNAKLELLFSEINTRYYHIDSMDIRKSLFPAHHILQELRSEICRLDSVDEELDFDDTESHRQIEEEPIINIVYTFKMDSSKWFTGENKRDFYEKFGGRVIYCADLALELKKGFLSFHHEAKILKNRFDISGKLVSLKGI